MSAAPLGAVVRAGVEIVIGNMCLRQTNQKKVCLMKVLLFVCVYKYMCMLFYYLCHSMKYKHKKVLYKMLSFQPSDK